MCVEICCPHTHLLIVRISIATTQQCNNNIISTRNTALELRISTVCVSPVGVAFCAERRQLTDRWSMKERRDVLMNLCVRSVISLCVVFQTSTEMHGHKVKSIQLVYSNDYIWVSQDSQVIAKVWSEIRGGATQMGRSPSKIDDALGLWSACVLCFRRPQRCTLLFTGH